MTQAPLTRVQLACLEVEQDLRHSTSLAEKAHHKRRLDALVALHELDHPSNPTVAGGMVSTTESPYMPARPPLADSVVQSSQALREVA